MVVDYAAVAMVTQVEVDSKDPTDSERNTTFVRKEHANLKFKVPSLRGEIPLKGLRTRKFVTSHLFKYLRRS